MESGYSLCKEKRVAKWTMASEILALHRAWSTPASNWPSNCEGFHTNRHMGVIHCFGLLSNLQSIHPFSGQNPKWGELPIHPDSRDETPTTMCPISSNSFTLTALQPIPQIQIQMPTHYNFNANGIQDLVGPAPHHMSCATP